jgi:CHASE3 domain sensor protein
MWFNFHSSNPAPDKTHPSTIKTMQMMSLVGILVVLSYVASYWTAYMENKSAKNKEHDGAIRIIHVCI